MEYEFQDHHPGTERAYRSYKEKLFGMENTKANRERWKKIWNNEDERKQLVLECTYGAQFLLESNDEMQLGTIELLHLRHCVEDVFESMLNDEAPGQKEDPIPEASELFLHRHMNITSGTIGQLRRGYGEELANNWLFKEHAALQEPERKTAI